ncbi:hypothetical protein CEXT_537561 [Caerostris extrusa]|uniref:Uncharacterized protein n=1 Tax=Caerostris extrusa TaxID=172846 RepID=A0AAV4UE76_CAEEX|nr:hypothetical protein CEXT_537561 [Caerostris extrusa]
MKRWLKDCCSPTLHDYVCKRVSYFLLLHVLKDAFLLNYQCRGYHSCRKRRTRPDCCFWNTFLKMRCLLLVHVLRLNRRRILADCCLWNTFLKMRCLLLVHVLRLNRRRILADCCLWNTFLKMRCPSSSCSKVE